jgi:hypothetical protein
MYATTYIPLPAAFWLFGSGLIRFGQYCQKENGLTVLIQNDNDGIYAAFFAHCTLANRIIDRED